MNDVTSPESLLENDSINTDKQRYLISFIFRLGAYSIDFFIFIIVLFTVTFYETESEIIFNLQLLFAAVAHGIYHVMYLYRKSATPGKKLVSQQVRDFKTGEAPTLKQCIKRLFGAYLSMLLFGLGNLWIIFDKNKRALHDYIAGTVVLSDDTYLSGEDDRPYIAPKDLSSKDAT